MGQAIQNRLSIVYNEWMHVKVIYAGSQADIYIDSETPVFRANDLKREVQGGTIGVNSANFSCSAFCKLQIHGTRQSVRASSYRSLR